MAESCLRAWAVDMNQFRDTLGDAEVEKDLDRAARHRATWEAEESPEELERDRAARVLEAACIEQANAGRWFGPAGEAVVLKSSEFDDQDRDIDAIVDYPKEDRHLALGFDVSYSGNVGRKLAKIKEKIDAAPEGDGEMPGVKYFKSGSRKGAIRNVPLVVVGIDRSAVRPLSAQWGNWITLRTQEAVMVRELRAAREKMTFTKTGEKVFPAGSKPEQIKAQAQELKRKLESHPIRRHPLRDMAMSEIVAQLKVFGEYARKRNRPRIAAAYDEALGVIQAKGAVPQGAVFDDPVWREVCEYKP